jgi:FemAB-related protein (PEP-CTERM system-associated)
VSPSLAPFGGNAAEWNGFVAGAGDGATHAHRFEWLEVIRDAFGHDAIPLACRDGTGALTGVLPLVRVRTPLFGHYLVSVPFLNYGGPLGSADAIRDLTAEAVRLGREARVKLTELRSLVEMPIDLPASHRKITVVLDLPSESEALWKAIPAKVRSQVRRPQKEGVTVRFGRDQVEPFYRVFARHMRDLGTPVLPRRLFESMAERFGDDAWFSVAWLGQEPVACGAGVTWLGESEIIWAASLREHNRIAPNMALYWAAMEQAIARGCRRFNFGRCTPGSGTHRFKQQWGGRDVPLWWYQDSPRGIGATPSPDGGYGLAVRLWQQLPLAVANRLGPHIVRGIP